MIALFFSFVIIIIVIIIIVMNLVAVYENG